MDNFLEKLKKVKTTVHIRSERKEEIKNTLIHFMNANSATAEVVRSNSFLNFFAYKLVPTLAVLFLVVMGGGSAAAAALRALPGDAFYGAKILGEEIKTAFTFEVEGKIAWETRRAELRIEEAAELSQKGEVKNEAKRDLETLFERHADRVVARIEEMEKEGKVEAAADLASRFETSLNAHANILARVEGESAVSADAEAGAAAPSLMHMKTATPEAVTDTGNGPAHIGSFEAKVRKAVTATSEARMGLEAKITKRSEPEVKASAEGKIKSTGNSLTETKRILQNKKAGLSAHAAADVEVKLKIAEGLAAEAEAKAKSNLFGEAFSLSSEAARLSDESKAIVNVESNPALSGVRATSTGEAGVNVQGAPPDPTNSQINPYKR